MTAKQKRTCKRHAANLAQLHEEIETGSKLSVHYLRKMIELRLEPRTHEYIQAHFKYHALKVCPE